MGGHTRKDTEHLSLGKGNIHMPRWTASDGKEKDWVVSEGKFYERCKNWRGPVHNGKFCDQKLKEKSNTTENWIKHEGTKFNGIPKYENPITPINSYKDQCQFHMIQNGMWDIFYIPDPRNAAK